MRFLRGTDTTTKPPPTHQRSSQGHSRCHSPTHGRHPTAITLAPNWCNAPLLAQGCPARLGWNLVGVAMEQAAPRAGLLRGSIALLSAALHWIVSSALLPHLVDRSMRRAAARHRGTTTAPHSQTNTPASPRPQATTTPSHNRSPHAGTHRPRGHNPQQHPAYMRARARPISRARALPTNRHEGGRLT